MYETMFKPYIYKQFKPFVRESIRLFPTYYDNVSYYPSLLMYSSKVVIFIIK